MGSDVEMKYLPSVVTQDDEDIEDVEGERRNGEEVDRDHVFHVVLQKRLPRLRGWSAFTSAQEVGDASFRDGSTKPDELTVDSWSTSKWIYRCHSQHKISDFRTNTAASRSPVSRFPSPKELESLPMLPYGSSWLDNNQRLSPVSPQPRKNHPKEAISVSQLWPNPRAFQDSQLLTQYEVFEN